MPDPSLPLTPPDPYVSTAAAGVRRRAMAWSAVAWLLCASAAAQLEEAGSQAPARACQPPGTIPDRGEIDRSARLPMDIRADYMRTEGPNAPIRFTGVVL